MHAGAVESGTEENGTEERVRRRANTRARLVTASRAVFADRGVDAATVDDLTGAAGFSRGAFYSNFSSKEEIFFEMYRGLTADVIDVVRQRLATTDPSDLTPDLVNDIFADLRPIGRLWYLIYTEASVLALRDQRWRHVFADQRVVMRREFAEVLGGILDVTGARPLVDLERVADVVFGVFLTFMVQEHLEDIDTAEIAQLAFPAIVEGMTVPADGDPAHRPGARCGPAGADRAESEQTGAAQRSAAQRSAAQRSADHPATDRPGAGP